jgi:CRP-like cAMP-binding protein
MGAAAALSSIDAGIVAFPAGTVLFREGDPGQEMYVIASGRVRISKRIRDIDKTVTVLPAGEFFGEMAIVNQRPRSASATVVEDAELLVVPPEAFDALVFHHRDVAVRLIRRLAQRLEEANQDLALLLDRDPQSRTARALKRLGQQRGHRAGRGVVIEMGACELAERIGLGSAELDAVLARLRATGIVGVVDDERLEIADPGRLDRFLEYLDLRHQFEAIV